MGKKKPELFRINIKPGGSNDHLASFQYCLDNSFLGVGWGLTEYNPIDEPITWEKYWKKISKEYENCKERPPSQVKYIKETVETDDLIWTRKPGKNADYYLARVLGEWEYRFSDLGRELDIFNVVPCRIKSVESLTKVPGSVQASFRGMTICRTDNSPGVVEYTKYLWNNLSGDKENANGYKLGNFLNKNLWRMLSADQIEDVIFIYLQSEEWWVVPNSRRTDKAAFEYSLVHPSTNRTAKVQVKSPGDKLLSPRNYIEEDKDYIFLFHADGSYGSEKTHKNVECLCPKKVESFLYKYKAAMPEPIQYWLSHFEQKGKL